MEARESSTACTPVANGSSIAALSMSIDFGTSQELVTGAMENPHR